MKVLHVMARHPETIGPAENLARAKEMMDTAGFRRLPVVKNGEVVGMLTERDLRAHVGYLEATAVSGAMSARVIAAAPDMSVKEAARLMLQHKVGGLPVIEKGRLVGVVTTTDLLKAFLQVIETAERDLVEPERRPG